MAGILRFILLLFHNANSFRCRVIAQARVVLTADLERLHTLSCEE